MGPQPAPLPEYDNPPVSEVALSIEFTPLMKWRSPHAGLYWGQINREYPQTEAQPPIPSQIEKFGEAFWQKTPLQFQMLTGDMNRYWFVAAPGTHLIQLQRDRFIVNWRKVRGDEKYPRYEREVRPRLVREWARFKQFIHDQDLGDIEVQQCEITYINDIVQGEGWNAVSDVLALFSQWGGTGSSGFLPPLETMMMSGTFAMPDERGRLHYVAQHVVRQLDNREAVQLRLIARGKPNSSSDDDVLAWMDFGRDWIVRGFTDLTSPLAHEIWKRTR
jgi:uncharacterized protein (TIGR04255 family)